MQKQREETTVPTETAGPTWSEVAGSTAGTVPFTPPEKKAPLKPAEVLKQPVPQEPVMEVPSEEFPPLEAPDEREKLKERRKAEEQVGEVPVTKEGKEPPRKRKRGRHRKPSEQKPAEPKDWDVPRKPSTHAAQPPPPAKEQEAEPTRKIELDFLGNTTIAQMLIELREERPRNLISIHYDATVQKAVEILANNKVLSAPVQNEKTNEWLGVIDMFDILRYIMKLYSSSFEEVLEGAEIEEEDYYEEDISSTSSSETEGGGVVAQFVTWFARLFGREPSLPPIDDKVKQKFLQDPISEVLKYSRYPKEITVSEEAILPQVISMFSSGLRRIVMLDQTGKVGNVISQWDIINFLYKHCDQLQELSEKTVEQLGFTDGEILCIREYSEAVNGFFQMDENHVSALGVIDSDGKLIGNLSVSDLRGLRAETFGALKLPVMEYLKTYAGQSTRIPPIVVGTTMTFSGLLELFLSNRVHRLWVADKDRRPLGIVSLTDVMRVIDRCW